MNDKENVVNESEKVYLWEIADFYREVLDQFFEEETMPFSMEMFSEFCTYTKELYSWFYRFANKEEDDMVFYFQGLEAVEYLVLIYSGETYIDKDHDIVQMFAAKIVGAINEMQRGRSHPDRIAELLTNVLKVGVEPPVMVWYDFENDTPEMVYDRLSENL